MNLLGVRYVWESVRRKSKNRAEGRERERKMGEGQWLLDGLSWTSWARDICGNEKGGRAKRGEGKEKEN